LALLITAPPAHAAPVAPGLSIVIEPRQLRPAQAGYVYVGGAYPLRLSVTFDGDPLETFWAGDGYVAVFAFGFDEPPGEHAIRVSVVDPASGEAVDYEARLTVEEFTYPLEQLGLPVRMLPLLDAQLNLDEETRLQEIYSERSHPDRWDWPFEIPVPGGVVTSRFGGNRVYNGGRFTSRHTGCDFRRGIGEPVQTTAAGRVAAAEFLDIRGNVIILDHGYGVFSQYAHLSEFFVEPGQWVEKGQVIGLAGATGRTNGPHLHFEIIVHGQPVDPIRWLALAPGFVPPREVTPTPVVAEGD
jgi:murein DD-endopeptidase MepM/ murein hydrolase activator NlpD